MNTQTDKPKIEWGEVSRFEKDGVTVIVNRSSHSRPYYSLEVQFANAFKGTPQRHHSIKREGQGKIVVKSCADIVRELILKAEEFTREMYQIAEDAYIEARERKEREYLENSKPKRIGGTHAKPTAK